jgi:hypothetical protein
MSGVRVFSADDFQSGRLYNQPVYFPIKASKVKGPFGPEQMTLVLNRINSSAVNGIMGTSALSLASIRQLLIIRKEVLGYEGT